MKASKLLLIACGLGLAATPALSPAFRLAALQSVEITGAGSTFVNPIMQRWIEEYKTLHSNVSINYQSIGSGGGVKAVHDQTVDFGASDYALTDEQIAGMPAPGVVQIPESAGPVCITYNIPGLQKTLRLKAASIAGIFLGAVTKWNDPGIAASNPGLNLPNSDIIVVHRSDGSGTTNIFTLYLSAVSGEWKTKVGVGPSPAWPVGLGGKGNEGVGGLVKQTSGSIGYVELAYSNENKLPVAEIQNAAGQFISPSAASAMAAIGDFSADMAKDVRHPVVNAPGRGSYPITGLTFLIVPVNGADAGKRQALKGFIEFVLGKGQDVSAPLGYATLPPAIRATGIKSLAQLKANGQPLK